MVFMGKIGWKIPYSQYMSIYHTPPDGFWSGKWCKNAIIVAPWLGSPCQVAGRQLLQNSLCPKINHLLADPYGSTDGLPVRKRKKNRPHHRKKGLVRWYPLVIWKITIFTGKTHYKWQLSIAMLVITRGYMMILHPQESVIKKLKTSWKKKNSPKHFLSHQVAQLVPQNWFSRSVVWPKRPGFEEALHGSIVSLHLWHVFVGQQKQKKEGTCYKHPPPAGRSQEKLGTL